MGAVSGGLLCAPAVDVFATYSIRQAMWAGSSAWWIKRGSWNDAARKAIARNEGEFGMRGDSRNERRRRGRGALESGCEGTAAERAEAGISSLDRLMLPSRLADMMGPTLYCSVLTGGWHGDAEETQRVGERRQLTLSSMRGVSRAWVQWRIGCASGRVPRDTPGFR